MRAPERGECRVGGTSRVLHGQPAVRPCPGSTGRPDHAACGCGPGQREACEQSDAGARAGQHEPRARL